MAREPSFESPTVAGNSARRAGARFRALMDLGRIQGISTTAAVAIVGALSSTRTPDIWAIVGLWLISVFAHTGGAAFNAIMERRAPEAPCEQMRPARLHGMITVAQAKLATCGVIATALVLTYVLFGFAAYMAIVISGAWMLYYSWLARQRSPLYDIAFAVAYPVYGLFGSLAVGMPTQWTLLLMAVVSTVAVFSRWDNGREYLDTDRRFGVPSFAVVWGLSMKLGVRAREPHYVHALALKCIFLAVVALPILFMRLPFTYFLVVFGIGYPAQVYVMWRFLRKRSRLEYLKTILIDVPLSWVLGSAIVIPVAGMLAYFAMKIFVVTGYIAGTSLQSGAENRFARNAPVSHV